MTTTATTTDRAVPEWLEETPAEPKYFLMMENGEGGWEQDAPLSRSEYESLKRHLGGMRGFDLADVEEPAPDLASGVASITPLDLYGKEILELADEAIEFRIGEGDGGSWEEPQKDDRLVFYMMLRDVRDDCAEDGAKPRMLSWAETMTKHARRIRAAFSSRTA
ncbi:MAG TPA: hypothetical protein VGK29_13665 [Paludibaculum sp.]|jgi:hypothetical protein